MTRVSTKQARQALKKVCQNYVRHNQAQLARLQSDPNLYKNYIPYQLKFFSRSRRMIPMRNFNPGFENWMSCVYAFLFDETSFWRSTHYYKYADIDQGFRWSNTFIPRDAFLQRHNRSDNEPLPLLLLNGLQHLCDFMTDTLVKKGKVEHFVERWASFHSENYDNPLFQEHALISIKIYLKLMQVRSLLQFTAGLRLYKEESTDHLVPFLDTVIPTLERFIKGAVVQDLQAILDDAELSDEKALELVGAHINDPMVRSILEKNLQSKAEHILKVLSVILIAVGIGIIPTVILASKRLYDSGGKSINFFKPLAKQVEGDIEGILANTIETPVL